MQDSRETNPFLINKEPWPEDGIIGLMMKWCSIGGTADRCQVAARAQMTCSSTKAFITRGTYALTLEDLARIEPSEAHSTSSWLNTAVLNIWIDKLRTLSEEVIISDTWFYNVLCNGTSPDEYVIKGLPPSKQGKRLFAYNRWIIPVNEGEHWACCMVDFRTKIIYYYDSLASNRARSVTRKGHPVNRIRKALAVYVAGKEYIRKEERMEDLASAMSITSKCVVVAGPRQTNACDCGIHTLLAIDCFARDKTIEKDSWDETCTDLVRNALVFFSIWPFK